MRLPSGDKSGPMYGADVPTVSMVLPERSTHVSFISWVCAAAPCVITRAIEAIATAITTRLLDMFMENSPVRTLISTVLWTERNHFAVRHHDVAQQPRVRTIASAAYFNGHCLADGFVEIRFLDVATLEKQRRGPFSR